MASYSDINQVDVGVYDKVREYYRIDKKLGGLIKVFVTTYIDKLGRNISIQIPGLHKDDTIIINGMEFGPKKDTPND